MKNICLLTLALSLSQMAYSQQTLASTELEAQNVKEVRVEGKFCDVYVKSGDRNFVKGIIIGKGDRGDFEFETDIVGETLMVRVFRKDRRNWGGYNLRESRLDITVLPGVTVDIDNSSGDISVVGISADYSKIEASSGDIEIRRVEAEMKVETTSGDISIDNLIGDLDVKSTSGDQELADVEGAIDSRASSGDIVVTSFEGELDVEATSGDIELKGGNGTIDARTTSGDIEGYDISLRGDAYFKASSGDIEVDFTNELADLSFDLTSSSGNMEVGSRSGEKKLYIDRGGYKVIGITSSGRQEYE